MLHPGRVDQASDGTYDEVYRATLSVPVDREFPIKRADRADGRIVTGRRPIQVYDAGRRVETVDVRIGREDGGVYVRLLLGFVDQRSGRPPRVRDTNGNGREDEVVAAAISRSFDASAVYDAYLDPSKAASRSIGPVGIDENSMVPKRRPGWLVRAHPFVSVDR